MLGKLENLIFEYAQGKTFQACAFDIVVESKSKALNNESNDSERIAENGLAEGPAGLCFLAGKKGKRRLPMPVR
jgi:hypothetical protein